MLWSVVPLAMFLKFLSCANVLSVNAKLTFFALYRSFFQQYGLVLSKFKNVASVLFFPLFSVCSIFCVFPTLLASYKRQTQPSFTMFAALFAWHTTTCSFFSSFFLPILVLVIFLLIMGETWRAELGLPVSKTLLLHLHIFHHQSRSMI